MLLSVFMVKSWVYTQSFCLYFESLFTEHLAYICYIVIADAWSKIETTSWFSQLIELA